VSTNISCVYSARNIHLQYNEYRARLPAPEGFTDLSGQPLPEMEGFDIHRPTPDDLIKYKKGASGYEQPKVHPAPKDGLPAFPDAERVRGKTQVQCGGKLRERWKDRDFIYEWDAQHGTVDKYNKRGNHIGEFDPNTGQQTKPKDSKRRIEP
jgi:hypothetical protein